MKKIFLFLVLPVLSCSCSNETDDIRRKFGEAQNPAREELNLVPVDPHLQLKEDPSVEGRRYIFIHEKEEGLRSPDYLRKIILLDSSGQHISVEEDYFKHPGENKYLITTHYYYNDSTVISLQAAGSSQTVDQHQADSILQAWKAGHNPFTKN